MSTVNKVFLIGYVGREPEVRYTQAGDAVTNFSIATTQRWKDGGEQREQTEWHKIVCFKRLGEIAGQYLQKGAHVCIQGRIQTRKWQDKDGNDRYSTEIIATELQMLARAAGREEPEHDSRPRTAPPNHPQRASSAGTRKSDGGLSEMEDDIPF